MEKTKLKQARTNKGLSYEDMANHCKGMETHSYRRREKGETKISKNEWLKFAEILEVDYDTIFEPEVEQTINITNENGQVNNNNHNARIEYYNLPKEIIDNQQDYINLLKQKIEKLEEEIELLKNNNNK
jgi:transcriptional regulator with XRE-family HTH domain